VRLGLAGLLTLGIPVLSTLGAWLTLNQRLGMVQIVGMVVVMTSLLFVIRHETQLHAV
jgi:drug/metabolite transporter (DMT)-like permease